MSKLEIYPQNQTPVRLKISTQSDHINLLVCINNMRPPYIGMKIKKPVRNKMIRQECVVSEVN